MTDTLRDLLRFTDEQKQELRRRMMTDTLRDRIVRVQAEHVEGQLTNYDTGREECGCGRQDSATYREHLADEVIAELGLREEMRYRGTFSFTPPQRRRYVTDWVTDE